MGSIRSFACGLPRFRSANMMRALCAIALLGVNVRLTFARDSDSFSTQQLEETTVRGRLLGEYLVALQEALKAITGLKPPNEVGLTYVAKKSDGKWHVAGGRLNQNASAFLITYEATQSSNNTDFSLQKHEVPLEDAGFYCTAARAIAVAVRDFQGQRGLYTTAVLPTDSNQIYVYVLPAQTKPDVLVFGGDARYLVSSDGARIKERRRMHKSIIEYRESDRSHLPAAGIHSHVITDVPEDSDVAYVLTRKPPTPEFVKTPDHLFLVQVDGTILRKQ